MKHFADIATLLAKTKPTSEHSAYITLAFCFPKSLCLPLSDYLQKINKTAPMCALWMLSHSLRQGPAHHTQLLLRKGSWHSRGHACRAGKAQAHPLSTAKNLPKVIQIDAKTQGFEQDSCGIPVDFSHLSSG